MHVLVLFPFEQKALQFKDKKNLGGESTVPHIALGTAPLLADLL